MLITSFGSHGSRVCASFAVNLATLLQSLFFTLPQLDVRIQGFLLGCAVISLVMCKFFVSKPSLFCMSHRDSQQLVRCLPALLHVARGGCSRSEDAVAALPERAEQNRRAKRKAERDNSLVGGLQRLVDRMQKLTFSGYPLVRIKQFIEAAERYQEFGTGQEETTFE